jgi:uncharacterized protein (TIGR00645 family)
MVASNQDPSSPRAQARPGHTIERLIETTIFSSRWILAPIYLGLACSLVLLLFKFSQKLWEMVLTAVSTDLSDTISNILSLVDLSLMANLVLMIMFGGYQNFVSELEFAGHKDKPTWIGHVGFGDLKLKLMASIVAISAIELLKSLMHVEQVASRDLSWSVGIHLAFVVSAVLLAVMDLVMARAQASALSVKVGERAGEHASS